MSHERSISPRPGGRSRKQHPPDVVQVQPWLHLRDISLPEGAKHRVLAAIEPRLRPRSRWLAVPALVAAAAVLLLWCHGRPSPSLPGPRVVVAAGVERDGARVANGDVLERGAIVVAEAGQLTFETETAHVDLRGPAALQLGERSVAVLHGALRVDGQLEIEGPGCTARVEGQSTVSVTEVQLEIRVFAGSAEVSQPGASCQVIDMRSTRELRAAEHVEPEPDQPRATARPGPAWPEATAEPEPDQPEATAKPRATAGLGPAARETADSADSDTSEPQAAAGPTPSSRTTAALPRRRRVATAATARTAEPDRSDLSRQVDAYWAAVRQRAGDPDRALRELRAMLVAWPSTVMKPEIELAIFDTLVILGRTAEAQAQARKILKQFPTTPRAHELERAAREVEAATKTTGNDSEAIDE